MNCRFSIAALILLATVANLRAADTTYTTEAPLAKPKKTSDRSTGSADKVELSIWVPDNVKVIRGAVFNPFNLKQTEQKHWQEAARLWGFAVIGANYFGVKNEDFSPSLLAGLKDFATKSGRPEIEHLPLCFVGMSAGSGMSISFAQQIPERSIAIGAVCLEVGPKSPELRKIPTVTIFGERDGKQMEQLLAKLPIERTESAQWAIAVQWGRKHEWARANNLLMPFFDAVIARRYPKDATPLAGPVKLLDFKESEGWIVDQSTWGAGPAKIGTFESFSGDIGSGGWTNAGWVPDQLNAHAWRAFVTQKPQIKLASHIGFGDGAGFQEASDKEPTIVRVESSVATDSAADKFTGKVEVYNGARLVGQADKLPAEINIGTLSRGIHALHAVRVDQDGQRSSSTLSAVLVK